MSDVIPAQTALVLIATGQEWPARSFESVLQRGGYAILRAFDARQTLEWARSARPDLVIVDVDLPGAGGIDVCRTLRDDEDVRASTPLLVTSTRSSTRHERIAALRAGAWEVIGFPVDAEELMLRLRAYLRAKHEADRVRRTALVDEQTGLYNFRGLLRRTGELAAHAYRHARPLACVAFGPPELRGDDGGRRDERGGEPLAARLARVLRAASRRGDALGRIGPGEVLVTAPETGEEGAIGLARRYAFLVASAERSGSDAAPAVRLRTGYYGVADFRQAFLEPLDMIVRATLALRAAQTSGDDALWIRGFRELDTD